jgi:hypothetical protein
MDACQLLEEIAIALQQSGQVNGQFFGGPNPVTVNQAAAKMLDANTRRVAYIITNIGLSTIYVNYTSPSGAAYVHALSPCGVPGDGTGGELIDFVWNGVVWVSSSAAGGIIQVSELIY